MKKVILLLLSVVILSSCEKETPLIYTDGFNESKDKLVELEIQDYFTRSVMNGDDFQYVKIICYTITIEVLSEFSDSTKPSKWSYSSEYNDGEIIKIDASNLSYNDRVSPETYIKLQSILKHEVLNMHD